ncbi:signal transduction histidine kinase LytS [Paenibacillus cellulosilyticus]|uniref:Circadian input-output histidine kinase CikA n=1 Tax=Paenibacillus cellulosilyticus TaxID=375489 RepID=A0A2V2YAS0_9BACL|nr:signal transduction histidine kinase LytS [Paenibacillus cellulosilyticus]
MKRTLIVCLLGLIAFSLIPLSMMMNRGNQSGDLRVQNGVMDLSSWNYEQDPIIRLDGDWEFYWNELLTPEDSRMNAPPVNTAYMKVPSNWNGKMVDGQALPSYGYATYRMVLRNVPYSGVFALKKNNIRFSSAVFVNGHKLFEDGKPSGDTEEYEPGNTPQFGLVALDKGDVEILVQVANYDYISAGIPNALSFGEQAAMIKQEEKNKTQEFGVLAILGALALIYLVCFTAAAMYRNVDYSLLIFALICALYAVYHGLIDERTLMMFLPDATFETMYRAKDIVSMVTMILLAMFFYKIHNNMISLKLLRVISIVLGVFVVLIGFAPIRIYTDLQAYVVAMYQVMLLWMLWRSAIFFIRSEPHNRFRALLLFMAVISFNLYSLDIILFALSLKGNLWIAQFYIFVFNVVVIFLIVLRFFEAYHTIDEMKNRLLQADKIKDDFLSNTSHELKTPLNAIVGITDTLLRGIEGPVTERQAQNLAIILGSGRRLANLVNELLDYSKMKHGDIVLHKSNIELKAIVDSVMRIHSFLLGGKPIALVNGIPQDFPAVQADGNRLIQILHNLVGNAIKFTDQGEVTVNARVVGGTVEIRVSDTGIGIEASMRERIFDAFEQADPSETRNYEGTGLGLSITKRLVELHGGAIGLESRLGQGTVFTFTLPRSHAILDVTAGRQKEAEVAYPNVAVPTMDYPVYIEGKTNERILVADDDSANLQAMINLLRLEGYAIVTVNRGAMALDELTGTPDFSLVILDIMMPDMSGYEVLQTIRERFTSFELPVLMLTARNRAYDVRSALEIGANDFVGKPFEAEELTARVRSLTRLKASVRNAANAEIAFLRSQINPHFLYNALNAIAELCIIEPQKAEELTLNLSEYLRSSFDFKQLSSLTTLRSEMELVQAYVHIERARFGNRLEVEYEVEADLGIRMPPLILQPLVENAIRHGLLSTFDRGKVFISVKKEAAGETRFIVADNGCGMSERRREEVLNLDADANADHRGVGLWNIGRRLKHLYDTSIHVESEEGAGTTVSFVIPANPTKW